MKEGITARSGWSRDDRRAWQLAAISLVAATGWLGCGDNLSQQSGDGGMDSDGGLMDSSMGDAPTDSMGVDGAPRVTILFPPPRSTTDRGSILVHGTAFDGDGVAAIEIAGVAATTNDGFVTWEAEVPLSVGANMLAVTSRDTLGAEDVQAASVVVNSAPNILVNPQAMVWHDDLTRWYVVDHDFDVSVLIAVNGTGERTLVAGNGPSLVDARGITVNPMSGELIVADAGLPGLFIVDPMTGDRTILSDSMHGVGTDFQSPVAVTWDSNADRLLVLDLTDIYEVSPTTGDRNLLISLPRSDEDILPGGITFDPVQGVQGTIYAAEGLLGAVYAVDVATTTFKILSDRRNGSGAALPIPDGVLWHAGLQRVLVTDGGQGAVIAIDPTNGVRTVVSDATVGGGPAMIVPSGIALDPVSGDAVVADEAFAALLAVDASDGDRTIVSATQQGQGATLSSQLGSMVLDWVSNRVIVLDDDNHTVVSVDPRTGDRLVLFQSQDVFDQLSGVTWDPDRNLVLYTDSSSSARAVFAVDPENPGMRSVISDATHGSGPLLVAPSGIAWDPVTNHILVTDTLADTVFAIDPASGDRTVLSSTTMGSGPVFAEPVSATWDQLASRLLVTDSVPPLRALLAVDPTSGDRIILSSATVGSGPAFSLPGDVSWDTRFNLPVVVDSFQRVAYAVALPSGDRSAIVNGGAAGRGPRLVAPGAVLRERGRVYRVVTDGVLHALIAIDDTTGERVILSR